MKKIQQNQKPTATTDCPILLLPRPVHPAKQRRGWRGVTKSGAIGAADDRTELGGRTGTMAGSRGLVHAAISIKQQRMEVVDGPVIQDGGTAAAAGVRE